MIRIIYVTVTYNAAGVLQRTLDSIMRQDYPKITHLIIDGASTDGTLAMVDEYIRRSNAANNGHRIQLTSEPDKGIYDTGTLYRSIEYGYRTVNSNNVAVGRGAGRIRTATVPDRMYFSFPMYGIYVEKGVGRGYDRGNTGLVKFEGKGINEKGVCVKGPEQLIGKTLVEVSEDFYRPTDVVNLWGDPTKAKAKLGWNPNKTTFEQLVKLMVDHDMGKVAAEGAAAKVRTNLAEYLEKGVVK